ncbi:type II secretion system F family protein [Corynebacterium sp. CNCTC7651]|uniref:type II secretion system F family protein n=1 Tax=Corynebacterium sp. CNCTC7651 TaxID=2815361 RepID=UPI001F46F5B5|nr:type II secretion system F family protein [Corynebacterium sp. CNCTC7651]UIZ92324.1 type II secretion system F family protein [Corynebacterium sp. CNCTC7651]
MSTGVSTAPLAALLLAAACLVTAPGPAHRLGARARGPRNPVWIPVGGCAVVLAALTVGRAGVVVAGGIAGATVVHVFSARRAAKEDTARTRHAATFIGHLAEGVGAGSTLADAAARAAEHIPPDAPEVLRRDVAQFVGAAQRGCTPPELATPELARVAALWELSTSRGVPVARLLAAARDDIDHAQRHRAATDAALAGPKTTAVVLALLPLAGIGMGSAMGADPIGVLTAPGFGSVLLIVGTALVCAGVAASGEIIRRAAA